MKHDDLLPIRRIVTGIDAEGRSCIIDDGESPAVMTMEQRPGFRNTNVWRTLGPDQVVGVADSIADHDGVLPPPGGTVFRIIDLPPEHPDPEERRRQSEASFRQLYPDAHLTDSEHHPGMHVTDTVDYAILLEGELVAIMDSGETAMRAGDVLIQRGTSHAWANRSGSTARMAFILVDCKR